MADMIRVCVAADESGEAILGMFDFFPQPDGTALTEWSMRDSEAPLRVVQALEQALGIARNA